MRPILLSACAAVLLAGAPGRLDAQCTGSSTTGVTITGAGSCSLTPIAVNGPTNQVVLPRLGAIVALGGATGATFNVGTVSLTDYDAGHLDLSGTIAVQSNRPFEIRLNGLNPTWAASNDATYGAGVAAWTSKPVGDLGVGASSASLAPLTTTVTTFTSQPAGNFIGTSVIPLYLRVYLDYGADKPGTYTLNNVQITLYLN